MGRIKTGVVIAEILLPFLPLPLSFPVFVVPVNTCSNTLSTDSVEFPRRRGCGKRVGEILEEKYKVEVEFPEWCTMPN